MQVVTLDTHRNGILKWLRIFSWSVMISTLTWTKQPSCWQGKCSFETDHKSGRRILFVATKTAKDIVAEKFLISTCRSWLKDGRVAHVDQLPTIRKAVKKYRKMEKTVLSLTTFQAEKLQISSNKIEKNLGSIADLTRLPAAFRGWRDEGVSL